LKRICTERKFGIGVDSKDGLLRQGAEGYQLTWMDAKVEGWVVTPRRGKAVEINGLWYNALCLMEKWAREEQGDSAAEPYASHAKRAKNPSTSGFWYAAGKSSVRRDRRRSGRRSLPAAQSAARVFAPIRAGRAALEGALLNRARTPADAGRLAFTRPGASRLLRQNTLAICARAKRAYHREPSGRG